MACEHEMDTLKVSIENLRDKASRLEHLMKSIWDSYNQLNVAVSEATRKTERIDKEIDSINKLLTEVSKLVENLMKRLSDLENRVNSMEEKIDNIRKESETTRKISLVSLLAFMFFAGVLLLFLSLVVLRIHA